MYIVIELFALLCDYKYYKIAIFKLLMLNKFHFKTQQMNILVYLFLFYF